MCRKPIFLISFILLAALVNSAAAQTWTNATGNRKWNDPLNWSGSVVPGIGATALINPPPLEGPIVNCNVNVRNIDGPKHNSASDQVMIVIADGNTINVIDDWRVANRGSGVGTLLIGGTPTINIGGRFRCADDEGFTTAIVDISGNPTININGQWRNSDQGGFSDIDISGGIINVGAEFRIGDDGSGTIDVFGGTINVDNWLLICRPLTSWAAFGMYGGQVNITGDLIMIQDYGAGMAFLDMDDGTINIGDDLELPGGNGMAILSMSSGNINVQDLFRLGTEGTGQVLLCGGTIKTGAFEMGPSGTMSICCLGKLIVDDPNGSVKTKIDGYVANGWITCIDSYCSEVMVAWNGTTTTVSCQPFGRKWSQPPIETDPDSEIPNYCGWDQESSMYDPCDNWDMVADDFHCLGSMPITAIHWWGSYDNWNRYYLPDDAPVAWRIGFWSNVPAGVDPNFSYPKELLWQIEAPAERVQSKWVGTDELDSDFCFRHYVKLEPNEWFWQDQFLADTNDDIYWLSIVAIYDPCEFQNQYEWGWKTRPWSWMDDAVRFEVHDNPQPGMVLDPCDNYIVPLKYEGESFDVSFELVTDPNYIKHEQPFTGIRDWPHYEDELSMMAREPVTEPTKWAQPPCLSDPCLCMDVDATLNTLFPPSHSPQALADDFLCTRTGLITDIRIWGSWLDDEPYSGDPNIASFTLCIYSNDPCGPDGYSIPNGPPLWTKTFDEGQFDVARYSEGPQAYYIPCDGWYDRNNHQTCWLYSFHIDPCDAFVQQEGTIYWLAVQATVPNERFGWKNSTEQWNDGAVWAVGGLPGSLGGWNELEHPETGESVDLAFEIETTEQMPGGDGAFGEPPLGPQQSKTGPVPPEAVQQRDARRLAVPRAPVVILGVPDYSWRHGCGPTAVGNVVGYYDGMGYGALIPGNASTQTAAVDQAIASGGPPPFAVWRHYEDYALPIDDPIDIIPPNTGPLADAWLGPPPVVPHPDDCIGDYMKTSWSTHPLGHNYYGWSWSNDVGPGFTAYVNLQNPSYDPSYTEYSPVTGKPMTWAVLTNEIDNGRPMVFLVDTDGDDKTDHFVTVVAYDPATNQYGCHDTWNPPFGVRWEAFQSMAPGQPWGIWGGWAFQLGGSVVKWEQPPDETEDGIDIRCDRNDGIQRTLADDFLCTSTGPITKVILWGSWRDDDKGEIEKIHLSIHSDDPCGPGGWSEPNELLWEKDFYAPDIYETLHRDGDEEWWWDPVFNTQIQWCDKMIWQYEITIGDSNQFIQQGDPCNPVVYWLDVYVEIDPCYPTSEFGWKTSTEHWNDDGVWSDDDGNDPNELRYPIGHPSEGDSIDLAFEIWTEPEVATRVVADDWPCDQNTPITAAAWWGSHIGYRYEACQQQQMPPPVKPDYFQLSMWTDAPATGPTKFSQEPDLDTTGMDVLAGPRFIDLVQNIWYETFLADDFECTQSGPVTGIHIWASYNEDERLTNQPRFSLVIYDNVPAGTGGIPYSRPGTPLWDAYVQPTAEWVYATADESFYDPNSDQIIGWDTQVWRFDFEFDPNDPNGLFIQEEGQIYWLGVHHTFDLDADGIVGGLDVLTLRTMWPGGPFGWKTSLDHFEDDGVWTKVDSLLGNGHVVPSGEIWNELRYPSGHPFDGNSIDLAFEISTGEGLSYSHPKDIIWEYNAYDYDDVLVGYDKHPEGGPNEPVFRYSVRIPKEDWFCQEEPNSVYWFSVVAAYDQNTPYYDWGWTNHEHVYNDNAVAGYVDATGAWVWEELYDQTETSVDMSFTLFTEPGCLPCDDPGYSLWLSLGKPDCWCYDCHSKGDTDGDCDVDTADISTLVAGWNSYLSGFCADTDNDGDVDTADVTNLLNGWNNGCGPGCVPVP